MGNGKRGAGEFTVTNVQVNAAGTQMTASVSIAAAAAAGPRLVRVTGPAGNSTGMLSMADTFTVTQ